MIMSPNGDIYVADVKADLTLSPGVVKYSPSDNTLPVSACMAAFACDEVPSILTKKLLFSQFFSSLPRQLSLQQQQ